MITTRADIGSLFQAHFKTGIGVEVGVQNGYNLKQICSQWQGVALGVDLWPDHYIHETALEQLKNSQAILRKGNSIEVAHWFSDGFFDWCYLDADHAYEAVKADFEAWYPKVRSGGIVSGHDFAPVSNKNDCDGVRQFIDEYMTLHPEIQMNFTTDDFWNGMEYQSWWFIKM